MECNYRGALAAMTAAQWHHRRPIAAACSWWRRLFHQAKEWERDQKPLALFAAVHVGRVLNRYVWTWVGERCVQELVSDWVGRRVDGWVNGWVGWVPDVSSAVRSTL